MKGDGQEACAKVSYSTRGEARNAQKSQDRKMGGHGRKPYRCSRCGFWHLGRGRKSKTWRQSKKSGGAGLSYDP